MSRPTNIGNVLALLAAFVVTAMAGGVLVAGLAMPAVGASGVLTKNSVDFFDSLPGDLAQPPLSVASKMLAADGSLITEFYDEKRDIKPLTQIAPIMQKSIIAIEDERFYEHGGIDPKGLTRAAVVNAITGRTAQGASTLTQQYVKNVIRETAVARGDKVAADAALEKSKSRKLKEIRYAVTLEQTMSKDKILENYLNIAWFGGQYYGVEAAARHFFNTSAKKLTLTQAATLAGMVQDPAKFSPEKNPGPSKVRRNIVLDKMLSLKIIDQATHDKAVKSKIGTHVTYTANGCANAGQNGFYCEYVRQQIIDNNAFSALGKTSAQRENALLRGGLTIKTALDPKIMRAAWKAVKDKVPPADKSRVAAATVTVQPGTGLVKQIQQNKTYDPNGNVNKGRNGLSYAVDAAFGGGAGFQTGSTFKPFTLATWLKAGKSLNATVPSGPGDYPYSSFKACGRRLIGGSYPFSNSADGQTSKSSMTVWDGTALSVNGVYVSMERQLDICDIRDTAEDLGVHLASPRKDECGGTKQTTRLPSCIPSLTLGVENISPMTMAAAYAAFADGGTFCKPTVVISVLNRDRKGLKVPGADCKRVLDEKVANTVTLGLSRVFTNGTAASVGPLTSGQKASGKTGTTNDSVDTWLVGYTPQLATAVWVGDPRSYKHKSYSGKISWARKSLNGRTVDGQYRPHIFGATIAGPIWKELMTAALKGTEIETFGKADQKLLKSDKKSLPNVQGKDIGVAFGILRAAGFTNITVDSKPVKSSVPPGKVAGTDPPGGSAVGPDTQITIFQSAGGGGNGGNGGGGGTGPGGGGPGGGTGPGTGTGNGNGNQLLGR